MNRILQIISDLFSDLDNYSENHKQLSIHVVNVGFLYTSPMDGVSNWHWGVSCGMLATLLEWRALPCLWYIICTRGAQYCTVSRADGCGKILIPKTGRWQLKICCFCSSLFGEMYPIWLIILQMGLVQPPTREEEERPEWNNIDNHGNSTVWNGRTLNQWSRELVTLEQVMKNLQDDAICSLIAHFLRKFYWETPEVTNTCSRSLPPGGLRPWNGQEQIRRQLSMCEARGGLDVGSLVFCWLVWIARPSPTKVRILKLCQIYNMD